MVIFFTFIHYTSRSLHTIQTNLICRALDFAATATWRPRPPSLMRIYWLPLTLGDLAYKRHGVTNAFVVLDCKHKLRNRQRLLHKNKTSPSAILVHSIKLSPNWFARIRQTGFKFNKSIVQKWKILNRFGKSITPLLCPASLHWQQT